MVCRDDPWDKRPRAAPISDRASSKKDIAKTEPSSNSGGTSVKTHLENKKHCPTATRDRSEEKAQKKQPCRLEGEACSKSWSRFPCSPWRRPCPSRLFPAAQEGQHGNRQPPCSRGLHPEGSTARAGAALGELVPQGSSSCTPWEGAQAGALHEWQGHSVMNRPQLPPSPSPCAKYGEGVEELGMKE